MTEQAISMDNRFSSSSISSPLILDNGVTKIKREKRFGMGMAFLFVGSLSSGVSPNYIDKLPQSSYVIHYDDFKGFGGGGNADSSKRDMFESFVTKLTTQAIDLEPEYQKLINENIKRLLW